MIILYHQGCTSRNYSRMYTTIIIMEHIHAIHASTVYVLYLLIALHLDQSFDTNPCSGHAVTIFIITLSSMHSTMSCPIFMQYTLTLCPPGQYEMLYVHYIIIPLLSSQWPCTRIKDDMDIYHPIHVQAMQLLFS